VAYFFWSIQHDRLISLLYTTHILMCNRRNRIRLNDPLI